jgi:hypothetical protein
MLNIPRYDSEFSLLKSHIRFVPEFDRDLA